ncbi:hypothetical protein ACSQ67_008504 [Phaseolus vulgaris]
MKQELARVFLTFLISFSTLLTFFPLSVKILPFFPLFHFFSFLNIYLINCGSSAPPPSSTTRSFTDDILDHHSPSLVSFCSETTTPYTIYPQSTTLARVS